MSRHGISIEEVQDQVGGWRAECRCGWSGERREGLVTAGDEGTEHLRHGKDEEGVKSAQTVIEGMLRVASGGLSESDVKTDIEAAQVWLETYASGRVRIAGLPG